MRPILLATIRDSTAGRPPEGGQWVSLAWWQDCRSAEAPRSIIVIVHLAGSAAIGTGNRARAVALGALVGARKITRKQDGFKLVLFHHPAALAFWAADRAFSTTTSAVEHTGSFRLGRLEQ